MSGLSRYCVCLLIVVAVVSLTSGGCSRDNSVVGLVNDEEITRQDLDQFINLMRLFNPDLDAMLQGNKDSAHLKEIQREFLQMLIGMKLIQQETENLSLSPDPLQIEEQTALILEELVNTHYSSSSEILEQRMKSLKLVRADISCIPLYEMQLQLYFDYVTSSITEADLKDYVEENPEFLHQGEGIEVYRITFTDEGLAQNSLQKLREGASLEQLVKEIIAGGSTVSSSSLGWLADDDPFIDRKIKELIFVGSEDEKGGVIHKEDSFHLYWPHDYRPAAILQLEDVIDEITMHKQYALYQDYFNNLWREARIEILLH